MSLLDRSILLFQLAAITVEMIKQCNRLKWRLCFLAGISIILVLVILQNQEKVSELRHLALSSILVRCPVENSWEKFTSIHLNGTNIEGVKRKFPIVNSWYPEISMDKIKFKDLCSSWEEPIDLLVFITSGTTKKSAERRQLARTTWLNAPNPHGHVRHIFALGLSTNAYENQRIFNESVRFGDILILDFTDTYRNLTLKIMSAMKWIALNCPDVKLVMKTDYDVFINIPKIAQFLANHDFTLPNSILGRYYRRSFVERNSTYKYYVPMEEYSLRYFPPYCSGSGYIMATSTVRKLVKMSYFIHQIRMEDAYLGVCAYCANLKLISNDQFGIEFPEIKDKNKNPEDLFSFMVVHSVPYDVISHLWNL